MMYLLWAAFSISSFDVAMNGLVSQGSSSDIPSTTAPSILPFSSSQMSTDDRMPPLALLRLTSSSVQLPI